MDTVTAAGGDVESNAAKLGALMRVAGESKRTGACRNKNKLANKLVTLPGSFFFLQATCSARRHSFPRRARGQPALLQAPPGEGGDAATLLRSTYLL